MWWLTSHVQGRQSGAHVDEHTFKQVLRGVILSIKSFKALKCGNDLLGLLPYPLPSAAILPFFLTHPFL